MSSKTAVLLNIEQRVYAMAHGPGVALDETFVARGELLDIDDDAGFERDPNGILRAFLLKAQHQELKGMSPRLMRALWHARVTIDGAYRRDPRNRATFIELLQQPKGVLHELRRMNQLSVLGRYLPVFRRIVGQMQHDLFHVYTVDQHILQVLRNLRRFSLAEYAHEYPLCSQLIADFAKPWMLYVAALFHDIAKGRGGDRVDISNERRDRLYLYDGKEFTMFAKRLGYYATIPAPPTIVQLADKMEEDYGYSVPLADLFCWGAASWTPDDITAATDFGPSDIEGTTCQHYLFRQADVDWRLWIQKGDYPFCLARSSSPRRPTRPPTSTPHPTRGTSPLRSTTKRLSSIHRTGRGRSCSAA